MISEQKEQVELEKAHFKQMLVAAHPQYADAILAEETEDDAPPVAEGFDYDTFDESVEGFAADDYTAMTDILSQFEEQGFHYEEVEE